MTETQTAAESEASARVAVVGVGNEIMGDDGVGPHVVRRLEETDLAASDAVALVNAGTTGFLALEALSGSDHAIVVDAIQTGDPPGSVHEYRCVEGRFEGDAPDMTMHDISFTEALAYSRGVYDLPDEIRILGIEPAAIEPAVEVSDELEAAIPDVIDMITAHIAQVVSEESPAEPETDRSAGRETDPSTGPETDRSAATAHEGEP